MTTLVEILDILTNQDHRRHLVIQDHRLTQVLIAPALIIMVDMTHRISTETQQIPQALQIVLPIGGTRLRQRARVKPLAVDHDFGFGLSYLVRR